MDDFAPKGSYVYTVEDVAVGGQLHALQAVTKIWECRWCGCAVTDTIQHRRVCVGHVRVNSAVSS